MEVEEIVVHESTMYIYQSYIRYNRRNKVQKRPQDNNQVQNEYNTGINKIIGSETNKTGKADNLQRFQSPECGNPNLRILRLTRA